MRHKSRERAAKKAESREAGRRRRRQIWERIQRWCERKIDHMVPPGFDWKLIVNWTVVGMIACSIGSMFLFWGHYGTARKSLERVDEVYAGKTVWVIGEGDMLPSFSWVMEGVMVPFVYLMIIILLLSGFHYLYYYQGSKSIYLMKRLPRRGEIHRRSFALPITLMGMCVILVFLLTVICFGWYYLWVPDRCIEPGQLVRFLREGIFTMWRGDGL